MFSYIIPIFVGLAGLCFGSFISAASYRLPRELNLATERSKCTNCATKLKALDLVPVLSWLFLRAKCRYCSVKISARYPITEIITAALFLFLWSKYGVSINFFILATLAVALMILIVSDFETYLIPDSTTITVFLTAIAYHYFNHPEYNDYIYGMIAGACIALALRYGFYVLTGKEGLGFGDVKFLPAAGLWVGFGSMPIFLVLSGSFGVLTGLVWKRITGNQEFPFGPALAIAMFVIVLYPQILNLK